MTMPPVPFSPDIFPGGYGIPREPSDPGVGYAPAVGPAPSFDRPSHPVTVTGLDANQLQQDLAQLIGRDVAIVARPAVAGRDGELRILDPKTGFELDVPAEVVEAALTDHTPPETAEARFAREFDAAATLEAQLGAYRELVGAQLAEREREQFLRARAQAKASSPRLSAPAAQQRPKPSVPPPVTSRNPWNQRQR